MSESKFLENCLQMQSVYCGEKKLGKYWNSESHQMIEQIKVYPPPRYPVISSKHYLLQTFGAACFQPDSHFEKSLFLRVLRKLHALVRKVFGYGRLGNLIQKPLGLDMSAVQHFLTYSKVNYKNAVTTGYLLLRDHIEKYDISTPDIYGEQRVLVEEGRYLAWETLRALKKALLIRDLIGEVDTILEIGAGTGELSRLMLLTGIAQRYIIVEIPPALAVSQEVLLSQFDESDIGCFSAERTDIDELAYKKCVLLLPSQTRLIKKANVGINTGSFLEMTQEIVRSYIELCKTIGLSGFVSINTRQPHEVNAEQKIDEEFYEKTFAPEFRVKSRFGWEKSLDMQLKPHDDSYTGYQLLHFVRV